MIEVALSGRVERCRRRADEGDGGEKGRMLASYRHAVVGNGRRRLHIAGTQGDVENHEIEREHPKPEDGVDLGCRACPLEWLAEEVVDAGGESTIWLADLASTGQEEALVAAMAAQIAAEYRAVSAEAERSAAQETEGQQKRTLARLRRELRRIHGRDYFPPPERDAAHRAVDVLATKIGEPVP